MGEFKIKLSAPAKKFVAEKGFDPQFGARPLNRAIQKHLEDPIAEFILTENPPEGSELSAKLDKKDEKIVIGLVKSPVADDVDQD
jgi:ATP-dependent Clp protease ATP-binding subunit ClpC